MITLLGLTSGAAYAGVLDGKAFAIQPVEEAKSANSQDELSFKDGRLFSASCAELGFEGGIYKSKVEGDTITFKSVTLSDNHGKIKWRGTVKGDTIEVSYVWTKRRWYWKDAYNEKQFEGNLKK
jgi:hypothetical protein